MAPHDGVQWRDVSVSRTRLLKIRGDELRDRHRRRPGRDERRCKDDWSLVSESCFLLAPLELSTVDPDAMQNDGKLAGDGGLGILDADASG
jgi:hypothetical protein